MDHVYLYGNFTKIAEQPDGTLYVEGICSSDSRDEDPKALQRWGKGELITADAMRAAIPEYMRFGAVREQHDPQRAAGTAISIEVRDDGKTYLAAHIVDAGSVKKIRSGVLKGFSVGGSATVRNAADPSVIESLRLTEISAVDRPAHPDCVFQIIKFAGEPDEEPDDAVALIKKVHAAGPRRWP